MLLLEGHNDQYSFVQPYLSYELDDYEGDMTRSVRSFGVHGILLGARAEGWPMTLIELCVAGLSETMVPFQTGPKPSIESFRPLRGTLRRSRVVREDSWR